MIAALSDATVITLVVVGFFVFVVLVVVTRSVMRRDTLPYRRYRLGVFVERDNCRADRDASTGRDRGAGDDG